MLRRTREQGYSTKKGYRPQILLVEEKVDVLLTVDIGEGPFHVLGNNLIQIYHIQTPLKVHEAVSLFNQNSLERVVTPTEENKTE